MNKTTLALLALGAVGCTKYYQGVVRDPRVTENGNLIFTQEYLKQTEDQLSGNKTRCLRSVYLNSEAPQLVLSQHCVPFDGTSGRYEATIVFADKEGTVTGCSSLTETTELGDIIGYEKNKCEERDFRVNGAHLHHAVSRALSWATLEGEDSKRYKKLP